jgi:hypothetical protein
MGDVASIAVKEEHDATWLSRRHIPGIEPDAIFGENTYGFASKTDAVGSRAKCT